MMSSKSRLLGLLLLILIVAGGLVFLRQKETTPVATEVMQPAQSVPAVAENPEARAVLDQVVQQRSSAKPTQIPAAKEVASWPDEKLSFLKSQALSMQVDGDRRSAALYLLTQAGVKAVPMLTEVAATPLPALQNVQDPHSAGSIQKTFELSLRIRALEAIDKAATQSPGLEKHLDFILEKQTDPTLKFLARVSQLGLQQGKPGKLQRFIDKALEEVEQKSGR